MLALLLAPFTHGRRAKLIEAIVAAEDEATRATASARAQRDGVASWLESKARAYELDAAHTEARPPIAPADWVPPYPGAPRPTTPALPPLARRAIAHELRDLARDLDLEQETR